MRNDRGGAWSGDLSRCSCGFTLERAANFAKLSGVSRWYKITSMKNVRVMPDLLRDPA